MAREREAFIAYPSLGIELAISALQTALKQPAVRALTRPLCPLAVGLYADIVTTVPVLQIDPDLAEGLTEPRLSAAVRACRARAVEIPAGQWEAVDELGGERSGFGLLVLSGILCRRVVQGESNGAEVVGPGDLLRPWEGIGGWASIPTDSTWQVVDPGRVAILDESFVLRASPYSEVSINLVRRALQRSRSLSAP